jgi:hypothetical protein
LIRNQGAVIGDYGAREHECRGAGERLESTVQGSMGAVEKKRKSTCQYVNEWIGNQGSGSRSATAWEPPLLVREISNASPVRELSKFYIDS